MTKRILLIGAQSIDDFIQAGRLVKQFEEDIKKYGKEVGRRHGIAYSFGAKHIYVWHTETQITIHFGD